MENNYDERKADNDVIWGYGERHHEERKFEYYTAWNLNSMIIMNIAIKE
ncbi:hypothetical protein [Radiobacillus sp. PE A8.2]